MYYDEATVLEVAVEMGNVSAEEASVTIDPTLDASADGSLCDGRSDHECTDDEVDEEGEACKVEEEEDDKEEAAEEEEENEEEEADD
ncbi:hypothetical protein CBR_g20377 [Chara braunii]|uniref:Uncharacterized protein n=1 Tax=Chara braunii TaxID=69332 RepID=A0A388JUA4_CHABU|nr:hypothetical protein CBR_g20377 [Chara braunii]|eukprot:GBG61343.1 hypothetical protein CBR_g20377 [Chara braunii]